MLANSIVIRQNPVLTWERFSKTLLAARGDFTGYQDDDRAMGGFWSCAFTYRDAPYRLYDMFNNGMCREVVAYGYGMRVLHEGLICEMVLNAPPDRLTTSIKTVFNQMWMRSDHDDDGESERSTALENTRSQGRHGIRERIMTGGQINSLSVADQAVQTLLDVRGWPSVSIDRGRAKGEISLEIFARGYIETLDWTVWNQTVDEGTHGMSDEFEDVFAGAEFVSSVVVEPNATLVTKVSDADMKRLSVGFSLAKLGDSENHRWIAYMTEGRVLHLAQAAPATVTA